MVYTGSAKPRFVSSTKCNRGTLTTFCLTRSLCVANLKVLKSIRTSNVQTTKLHPPSITPNTSNRTLVFSLSLSPSDHASRCQLQLLGWPPTQQKNQQPTQDAVNQPISLLPAHFLNSYPTVRANLHSWLFSIARLFSTSKPPQPSSLQTDSAHNCSSIPSHNLAPSIVLDQPPCSFSSIRHLCLPVQHFTHTQRGFPCTPIQ